jgi:sigma-B regulation protein RsbU (phosphoserine phosphatase)
VATQSGRAWLTIAAAVSRLRSVLVWKGGGYEVALAYRPAATATGDYHGFFPLPGGRTAVFVGDGSGHGPAASVLAATARAIFRTHPGLHGEAGDTLTAAGRLLHGLIPSDLFMTGLYLLLGEAGWVSWSSAGHEPPLRLSPAGRVTAADVDTGGLPLGIDPAEVYATVHWQLAPGERLLLFTDGLVEARGSDGEMFSRRRLRAEFARLASVPLPEMVRRLIARVENHQGAGQFEDDFTTVAVERVVLPGRWPHRERGNHGNDQA